MKNRILIFSMAALMAACNSNPKATTTESKAKEAPAKTTATAPAAATRKTEASTASTASTGEMTSESDNSAKAKKGWSKTAKGAVIGGVVGAGTGAVVNKKNRAVGAVVGGVVGAGAGAIVGNELDKKDGRH
jgi:FKBP-type peptidyl-prolyl cis-trans isomerase